MIHEMMDLVARTDPAIADAIRAEYERQSDGLELIASENVVSEAVMCAMGSVLTNKYAEGYPAKRYYGGCQCVDVAENIAIERACKLFGAKWSFTNVSRISVCPDLHISLNPVDSGTIIGVHAAPNPLSDVSVFRFFPIMWLVIAISSLLTDGSFVTILLLCATPLVILYWWLISRKVKHYYTAGTDRILKRLAAILQATLEDVQLNETSHG